jgi:AraC-like DNA-binding protein
MVSSRRALVEQHRRPPFEGPEHVPHAHLINICLGPPSFLEWWIAGERPRRQLVSPGDVHLTSAGVPMRNRSQESFETLVLALAPRFVQHAAPESVGADRLERLSITEVAERVGFASQAHLTVVFHQRVGTTPRQYRRQR